MEGVLGYVCMVLLFLIYRITLLVNCDTYAGLHESEVGNEKGRLFLRTRRIRVLMGQMILMTCSVRAFYCYMGIPLVNMVCRLCRSDLRFRMDLASVGELYTVSGICIVILLGYLWEKRIWTRFVREVEEEESGR